MKLIITADIKYTERKIKKTFKNFILKSLMLFSCIISVICDQIVIELKTIGDYISSKLDEEETKKK